MMRFLCLLLVLSLAAAGMAAEQAAPPAESIPKVTVDLKDATLRDGIRLLFEGSGLQYSIEPNVPNVPVNLRVRDVSVPAALRLLVRQAAEAVPGLTFSRDGQVYVVRVRPAEAHAAAWPQVLLAGAGEEKKVTLNLRDMPLRDAIKTLFSGSGLQYAVEPNVPNVPVNLNVRDVGIPQALRLIVRQAAVSAPGLTFSRDGDVFVIRLRQPEPPPMEMPPPELVAAAELIWEKVPLQYVDVATATQVLGGELIPVGKAPAGSAAGIPAMPPGASSPLAALAPGLAAGLGGGYSGTLGKMVPEGITGIFGIRTDNTLLVRGTPEDIEQLKRILRLLDIPARQIRVRLSAGSMAAEGLVMNGASLRLADSAGQDRLSAGHRPAQRGWNGGADGGRDRHGCRHDSAAGDPGTGAAGRGRAASHCRSGEPAGARMGPGKHRAGAVAGLASFGGERWRYPRAIRVSI